MCGCYRVGATTITPIVEQQGPFFDAKVFFPDLTDDLLRENAPWLEPTYVDAAGRLILCIQGYLVRTPRHTILVDTCVGNHKPRPGRGPWDMMASDRYERGLAAAGVSVHDIDVVMCTHLHIDHVGWNTRLQDGRWVPTFPHARYIFSQRELDHWTGRHETDPETCPWMADSVFPILEARLADLVQSDHAFADGIHLEPTPGHTIDHFSVRVADGQDRAVVTGDMVHSPLQMRYPEIGMLSDFDRAVAGRTRRRLFEEICDTPTLLCTAHFPTPSTGRVSRWDDGFRFTPVLAEGGG